MNTLNDISVAHNVTSRAVFKHTDRGITKWAIPTLVLHQKPLYSIEIASHASVNEAINK